jgi:kynurenine formamidase
MKKMFELPHYVIYILLSSCASTQTSGSLPSTYSEDLSYLHPIFEQQPDLKTAQPFQEKRKSEYVEPKFTVNKLLHDVLDSIDQINLSRKMLDGFCIQVYSGQKKEDALNVKRTMDQYMPEMKAEIVYTQPTFRIKAGKYYTQLDAQENFAEVKNYFPNAILIPDKIAID